MRKVVMCFLLLMPLLSFAATLRVPQDYPTPQAAVAASIYGDVILISPGMYVVPPVPFQLANGMTVRVGLALHDGTTLQGSGPAQTVLDMRGADHGVLVQSATATVKLIQIKNAVSANIFVYIAGVATISNVISTKDTPFCCGAIAFDQGNAYTVYNSTVDHSAYGDGGINVSFFGTFNAQNNLVTNNGYGIYFYYYPLQGAAYNDVFGSTISNWVYCESPGCAPIDPLPDNISADPLYCPDFSLQPASPAIHAGNPAILNPDGTRSDMGAYGGPEAILPPVTATPCVVDFGDVRLGKQRKIKVNLRSNTMGWLVEELNHISTTDPAFTATSPGGHNPLLVPFGGESSMTITFSPAGIGQFSGQISFPTDQLGNFYNAPTVINVTGRGTSKK
jgi:hypothetical protein